MSIVYTTHYNLIKRSYLDTLWHTSVNSNMDTLDTTLYSFSLDIAGKIDTTTKGAINGVASLDGSGTVPTVQIPSLAISKITGLQTALNGLTTNATTTIGDMLYCSVSGTPGTISRLSVGSNGQVLSSNGAVPTWLTPTWMTNVITTKGDLIIGDNAGSPVRLPAGSNGYVLTAGSGTSSWQPIPSNLNAIVAPYNLAASPSIGVSTYAALADHVHSYAGLLTNVLTTAGDLLIAGSTGAPARLGIGAPGTVLTVSGSNLPSWAAPTAASVTASVTPVNLASVAAIGTSAEAARADHVHSFSNLLDSIGTLSYKGAWNANTNSPVIPAAASGNKGFYYVVGTAGSTNVDGVTDWKIGDWLVSNGTTWDKIDVTDQVTSVAGRTGAVTLSVGDVSGAAPAASPTFSGTVTLPTGTTGAAPLKFQAGAKLDTPVAHAVDWDGSKLYVTNSVPIRREVAFLDSPVFTGTITIPAGATGTSPMIFQAGVTMTTPVAHAVEWNGSSLFITNSVPTRREVAFLDSPIFTGTPAITSQALTTATLTQIKSATVVSTMSTYTWSNAQVQSIGAVAAGDLKVCTLPAKTIVKRAYIIINTSGSTVTTLTVSLGRVGTSYTDYITASDAKAAANTVYLDSIADVDLPSVTGTTDVYVHFISTGGNLSTVTTSTGTIYLDTMILP